jgi:hypothetical protein
MRWGGGGVISGGMITKDTTPVGGVCGMWMLGGMPLFKFQIKSCACGEGCHCLVQHKSGHRSWRPFTGGAVISPLSGETGIRSVLVPGRPRLLPGNILVRNIHGISCPLSRVLRQDYVAGALAMLMGVARTEATAAPGRVGEGRLGLAWLGITCFECWEG